MNKKYMNKNTETVDLIKNINSRVQKAELRKKCYLVSKTLTEEYKKTSSQKIFEEIVNLESYKEAKNIFCYVNMENEPNTRILIDDSLKKGKNVYIPKVYKMGVMRAYKFSSWGNLEEGVFGILEPKEENSGNPENFDLIIVPCLAYNYKGDRLGHGRGYYDRYLENLDCKKVIVAFSKFCFEDIPMEDFDKKVNVIIDEKGVKNV